MTVSSDDRSPPAFLCPVLCPDAGGGLHVRGSGILLAERWLLTARHVVQSQEKRQGGAKFWGDLIRDLCIDRDGLRIRVDLPDRPDRLICDPDGADVALLPLPEPVRGPYAPLLTGIRRLPPGDALGLIVTCWGFAASRPAGAAPVSRTWALTGEEATWHDGVLLDLQLNGGMEEGVSGGAVCTGFQGEQRIVAMIQLGGKAAGTTRADAVPRLLPLLRNRPGLELDVASHALAAPAPASSPRPCREPLRSLPPNIHQVLCGFLRALPIWLPETKAMAFCQAALGDDHVALLNTSFTGDRFVISANLAMGLVRFDLARSADGCHGVCGLLRVAREYGYDRRSEVAHFIPMLAQAFGCPVQ